MVEWLKTFSQKYGLNSNVEHFYFFNVLGDATLYLILDDNQMNRLATFFKHEHDASELRHM